MHLAEFDKRRGWDALGYGTLWDFCARELKLQKSCIYRRTNAAWVIGRFPVAIPRLRSGALTMTTLVVLKDVLTELNAEDVLTAAEWKSKDDVEAIAASLAPKPAPKPMIRKLPAPRSTSTAEIEKPVEATALAFDLPAPQKGTIEATALDGVEYSFRGVAKQAFADKRRCAQEILSHAVPDGACPRSHGEGDRHCAIQPQHPCRGRARGPPTRRRSLLLSARGRLALRIPLEARARPHRGVGARRRLDRGNLRLVCRAHNALHARETFGADVIDRNVASSFSGATRTAVGAVGVRPSGR